MPGVCMMPGIVSVLAGLGVRSVILLAAVRVRVLCECVSDGSAVTRLLARALRCICCAEMPGGLHDARRMVPGVRLVMLLEAMCICSASVF